jgi:hypothetical protein
VDQRLKLIHGRRLQRLTKNELPEVARALVGYIRGSAKGDFGVYQDRPFMHFYNETGVNVIINYADWLKITPYFQDESFDPRILPVPKVVVCYPGQRFDQSVVDLNDRELYTRVYTVLDKLFTIEFPTSN